MDIKNHNRLISNKVLRLETIVARDLQLSENYIFVTSFVESVQIGEVIRKENVSSYVKNEINDFRTVFMF